MNHPTPIVGLTKAKSERHARHYVEDPPTCEVENYLFRIPTNVLRGSPYFSIMLDAERMARPKDGCSDDQPIMLQGITTEEFEGFLDVIFARLIDGPISLSLDQLSAALHLSTMWSFEGVRKYAIKQIQSRFSSQDPLDRLDLAIKCKVDEWRLPVYTTLCEREAPLTGAEGSRLGSDRFAAICRIREKRRGTPNQPIHCTGCSSRSRGYYYGSDCKGAISIPHLNTAVEITADSNLPLHSIMGCDNAPSSPLTLDSKAKPDRHERHYIEYFLIFEVEEHLFRIPVNVLRGSPYFSDMLDAEHTGNPKEGSSDEQPIILHGITARELESFLDIIFARLIDGPIPQDLDQLSAALHLSTMWSFDAVRSYAIEQIESMFSSQDPFDRLDLAFKCDVDKWRLPAYVTICERVGPLTGTEVARLGFSRFAGINRVREKCRRADGSQSATCGVCHQCLYGYGCTNRQPDTVGLIHAESDLPLESSNA